MDGLRRVNCALENVCDGVLRGAEPDADALEALAKFLLAFLVAAQVSKVALSSQTPAVPAYR